MKLFKNESGRSMVEMLGVLAIIGVLSVGGVTGYRYAMEQITLNRVSEMVKMLLMSFAPEQTLYEAMRDPDNDDQFPEISILGVPVEVQAEITRRFANAYGFKCPPDLKFESSAVAFGCPLGSNVYFSVQVGNDFGNWKTGEYLALYLKLRSSVNRDASDVRFFGRVLERVRATLKANRDMADSFYGISGHGACSAAKIDQCFDYFSNSDNWGGYPASSVPIYAVIVFLY